MENIDPAERREFFRIQDHLPLEFRAITRTEFLQLEDRVKYSSSIVFDTMHEIYFLREKIVGNETKKDKLYAYMQLIDKKLDTVIELLTKSKSDESYTIRYVPVDIGGAGIRFTSDLRLNFGDYVDMKIILPIFPYPKVTALCEVLRSKEASVQDEGRDPPSWDIALKFLTISEKDRDCLINYIFLKEREVLRSRKEETGG
jgi:hypothetical protein